MRALVFHFSSLVGLLVFLNQLWNAAEIERTLFMAFGAGLAMYTLLMVGYAVAHRILAHAPPGTADEAAPAASRAPTTRGPETTVTDHAESPVP